LANTFGVQYQSHQFFKKHHLGGFSDRSERGILGFCLMGRSFLVDLMEKMRSTQHFHEGMKGMISSS
jgi:hypothetical protein